MARTFVGTVSSDATDKTIVVTVSRSKTHPLYRKRYMVTKKFMAHDEKNEAKVGDRVRIVECRPMSARKRSGLAVAGPMGQTIFARRVTYARLVPDGLHRQRLPG